MKTDSDQETEKSIKGSADKVNLDVDAIKGSMTIKDAAEAVKVELRHD